MKGTLNRVILIGAVGQPPKSKTVGNDMAITNISLATIKVKGSKVKGNYEEITDWHNVVLFGQPASFCRDYINKGDKVCVEGSLSNSSWVDEAGVKKYKTEVVGESIQILKSTKEKHDAAKNESNESKEEGAVPNFADDDVPF